MTRDALFIQAEEIRIEMAGISPKTELWKKLDKELQEIYKKTGGRQKGLPLITVRPWGGTNKERFSFNKVQKRRLHKRRRQIEYKNLVTKKKMPEIGETNDLTKTQILAQVITTYHGKLKAI